MLHSFRSISIIRILLLIIFTHNPVFGDECVDTIRWNDRRNKFTCSDYSTRGWCVNKSVVTGLQNNSMASLNFPDLNCCACGKRASLKLPSNARWNQNGITIAGTADGTGGSSFNILDQNYGLYYTNDLLYVADTYNNRMVLIGSNPTTATRVIGGPSQPNMFNRPTDVFVTRTSIYVMDTWNFRVQKWSKDFFDPVTVAGISGMPGNSTDMSMLSEAHDLFVDNYDNLFVSDVNNHRVMRFPWNSTSGTSGVMVAGTGVLGNGSDQLHQPRGVFVTDDGTMYIADSFNHRIQKWIKGAKSGVTVAGTGSPGRGVSELRWPLKVLVDVNGYLYIADFANVRIVRWAPGGTVGQCIVGCSGYWGVGSNVFCAPTSLAFGSDGTLYVNDRDNNRVQKFDTLTLSPSTSTQTTVIISTIAYLKIPSDAKWANTAITVAGSERGINGSSYRGLSLNYGLSYADDILYVADTHNNRIVLIKSNSIVAIALAGGYAQENMFNGPTDVFVTRTSIYVMDTWNFRVQKWSKDFFDPVTVAGIFGMRGNSTDMSMLSEAHDLFVDNYDNLFVSDMNNHRVMRFPWNSTSGTSGVMVAGTGVSGNGSDQLHQPRGVFVTDDGTMYIADSFNHRIQKWIKGAKSGVTVAGTGSPGRGVSELMWPLNVLVDVNGYLYIADYGNDRIVRWAPGGTVGQCIAGCFVRGVLSYMLNGPTSIAFDSGGSLYVNDYGNNRVQKFDMLNEKSLTSSSSQSTTVQTTVSTTSETTTQSIQTTMSTNRTQRTTAASSTTTTRSKASLIESTVVLSLMMFLCMQILTYCEI